MATVDDMTDTQDFFMQQIAESAVKAFGIVPVVTAEDGHIMLRLDPSSNDTPFWKAVAEQMGPKE